MAGYNDDEDKDQAKREREREHYKAIGNAAEPARSGAQTIGGGAGMVGGGASRISARHVIEQRIYQLQAEAHDLQTLLRALPLEMPTAAESALWTLVTRTGIGSGGR